MESEVVPDVTTSSLWFPGYGPGCKKCNQIGNVCMYVRTFVCFHNTTGKMLQVHNNSCWYSYQWLSFDSICFVEIMG